MNEGSHSLAVKANLALSRAELLAAMGYEEAQDKSGGPVHVIRAPATPNALLQGQQRLDHLLQNRSARLVTCGAGAAAILWLIRPWRLLPLAATAALIAKCSGLATGISRRVAPRHAARRQMDAPR